MFITLTFTYQSGLKTRTVNAAEIAEIETTYWEVGGRRVNGSKIVWRDRNRAHSTVTATPDTIARALGAKDVSS